MYEQKWNIIFNLAMLMAEMDVFLQIMYTFIVMYGREFNPVWITGYSINYNFDIEKEGERVTQI